MKSLYVITAVGKDKPGLLHSLTNKLAGLGINIVDVDARAIRGHFSCFLVVDLLPAGCSYMEMTMAVEPVRADFNLGLRIEPYKAGRRKADKQRMIFTLMGIDKPGIVASVSGIFNEYRINIESIRMIARGEYIAMEIMVDTSEVDDISIIKNILYDYAEKTGLDVSLRDHNIFQKPKRIVFFDCDSTIIQEEAIDKLAEAAGVGSDVKKMTEKAMNGEIDFKQSLKERARLLKGLPVCKLISIIKTINLTPGAEELISTLRFMGYKIGVISGGFTFLTDYLKKRLNLDYVFANELEIKDDVVTGKIVGNIIDAEQKGQIIRNVAQLENISTDQIVAVGDGSNDRFMLENAGLAIAFNPKEILKDYSDGMITTENISGLRYFMGIPDKTK